MQQEAPAAAQGLGHPSDVPWGCLKLILSSVALYEACCLGSTSLAYRDAVIHSRTVVPITQLLLRQRPGELITPRFRRMLSVLLEYHLPAACPHAVVMFQWYDRSLTFCCNACRGFLRFDERKSLPSMLLVAYTLSMGEQAIKRACLQILNSPANPAVGSKSPPRRGRSGLSVINDDDEKRGHVEELVLKLVAPVLFASPKPAQVAWEPICTCVACGLSAGGDISGDEFHDPRAGRLGRRKGRRGNRNSRVMEESTRVCLYAKKQD
mmetsp:Transcript_59723/g.182427  ORF Transcript_59723/g.182427 Transcript_59723/m.182427 type:complete len:266 (-) Transcript_59723:159-956(-)